MIQGKAKAKVFECDKSKKKKYHSYHKHIHYPFLLL